MRKAYIPCLFANTDANEQILISSNLEDFPGNAGYPNRRNFI